MSLFKALLRAGSGAIVALLLAGVAFYIAATTTYKNITMLSDSIRTEAVITKKASHVPTLEFVAQNGQKYQVSPNTTYKSRNVGDIMTIYYKANDPNVFVIDSLFEIWLFPAMFFVFGFVLSGLVIAATYLKRNPSKKNRSVAVQTR
jgi:hypothetical protein